MQKKLKPLSKKVLIADDDPGTCRCTKPFARGMGTPVPRSETSASQSAYSSVKYECIRPETEKDWQM